MMELFQTISEFDTICVFRHINPDGDANGSQFGIKSFIEHKFPEKKVFAFGIENNPTFFPKCTHEEVDFSNALAIVTDTANHERIDGEGYKECAKIIKIDHHPIVDNFGDINYVDEKACATCEVIGKMFMESNEILTKETATYLYCGLLTDSQKFSIPSVTQDTFKVAAYLLSFGVDIQLCNQKMFSSTVKEFQFETYIRSNVQYVNEHIAYIIVNIEDYEKFGLTFEQAKSKVFVLSNVDEIDMYCLFTQASDTTYNGSLRSKKVTINDIAAHYHGGGHKLASGVKKLSMDDIHSLLNELEIRYNEK